MQALGSLHKYVPQFTAGSYVLGIVNTGVLTLCYAVSSGMFLLQVCTHRACNSVKTP